MNLPDAKTGIVAEIISSRFQNIKNLLVVGCGTGIEAAVLGQELHADVVGIDLEDSFDAQATQYADLKVGDATALEFEDDSFDFLYTYHTLEHIPVDDVTHYVDTRARHRMDDAHFLFHGGENLRDLPPDGPEADHDDRPVLRDGSGHLAELLDALRGSRGHQNRAGADGLIRGRGRV